MDAVCCNEAIAADGFANWERSMVICDTFECDYIDLRHEFDYELPLHSGDLNIIDAAYHLSRLQAQFFFLLHNDENQEQDVRDFFEVQAGYMQLVSLRLQHVRHCISKGKAVSKETFIN